MNTSYDVDNKNNLKFYFAIRVIVYNQNECNFQKGLSSFVGTVKYSISFLIYLLNYLKKKQYNDGYKT